MSDEFREIRELLEAIIEQGRDWSLSSVSALAALNRLEAKIAEKGKAKCDRRCRVWINGTEYTSYNAAVEAIERRAVPVQPFASEEE